MFRHPRQDEDFLKEIEAHLELETDRLVGEGLARDDARAAAQRAFGNVTRTREDFHERSRLVWLEQTLLDLRYAARGLRQRPAFLLTTVLTLAVGIAVVTVAFTVFNAYVLRPYAVRSPETLHRLSWRTETGGSASFRWRDYEAMRDRRDLFDGVVAQDLERVTLNARPVTVALVSANYFTELAPRMSFGRALTTIDAQPPATTAVIAHHVWTALFAADPAIIGRSAELSGRTFTIVGVAGPEFAGLGEAPVDAWLLYPVYASLLKPALLGDQQPWSVDVLGRLQPGIHIGQAEAAVAPMLAALRADQEPLRVTVKPEPTPIPLDGELLLIVMPIFAAFGLVLVTACANLSNVMLARAVARHREIAVRLSIGASRGRIIRQLLAEGVLIALLAGATAVAMASWSLRLATTVFFAALPPSFSEIIRLAPLTLDARVLAFAAIVSLAATVLFALLPAVQASRVPLMSALHDRVAGSWRDSRFRDVLITGQVAVSMVLVVAALTFTRGGLALGTVDLRYDIDQVVSLTPLADARALIPQVASQLAADPRVEAVSVTGGNPLKGRATNRRLAVSPAGSHTPTIARFTFVAPGYFELLRLRIDQGRSFTADEANGAPVAIVSAATAAALWPDQNAIGKTLAIEPANGRPVVDLDMPAVTVVGVARDVISGFIADGLDATHLYLPLAADDGYASAVLVRGRPGADLTKTVLPELYQRLGADPQAFETLPLVELRAAQLFPLQAAALIGALLGLIALVLSVSGLFGVLTYNVNQRTREIGIRMALGASAAAVVRLVMHQSARLAVVGAALGLVVAFGVMRAMDAAVQFDEVSMLDAVAFAAAPLLVLSAAALAALQPARRATNVHPAITLRVDG